MVYGGRALPRPHAPLPRLNKWNTGHYIWGRLGCKSCLKVFSADNQLPSGLHFEFSARIYFHRLFPNVFLPIDGLSFSAVEPHLHDVAEYEAPVFPFIGLELNLVVRGYLRRLSQKNFIDSESLSPLSPSVMKIFRR